MTEASWLKENPPEEVFAFWQRAYPAMRSVSENLRTAEGCGYRQISHFSLPESDWWDHYYLPIEPKLGALRRKYAGDASALEVLEEERVEIELYRRYSAWYGYVFYVMQRK